jgi:predicted dehydrogenase
MTETATLPHSPRQRVGRPRLGFVGVGWIGRHRLEAIAQSGYAEISAITDTNASLVEQTARELAPKAARAASFDELIEGDLDGVVIATPNALHATQAIAALHRGLAVFCQKPLARNADETKLVLAAARSADRRLDVDLSYRFTSGMTAIRNLIRQGALGHVYAADLVFHNAYGPDKPWFYDSKLSGGGCLLDLGIHLVDLALWCLDFPAVKRATGTVIDCARFAGGPSIGVEDYAAAQLTLATGASIQLACSWKAPAGCDARIEATFFGTGGGASFRNVDGSFYNFVAEHLRPDRTRHLLAAPPDTWGGRAAVDWARRLAISPRFDPAIGHVEAVAATLDRIYESAK